MAISPDGKMVASGTRSDGIKLWNINGRLLVTLKHGNVCKVIFSPDGEMLAASSRKRSIRLWSAEGTLLKTIKTPKDTCDLSFGQDGKTLITESRNGTVRFWDLEGKILRTSASKTKRFKFQAFSLDGKYTVSSWGSKIHLRSLDGKIFRTIKTDAGRVTALAFSPDGKTILVGGRVFLSTRRIITLWGLDGSSKGKFETHSGEIVSLAFAPDGQTFASGSSDNTIKLWTRKGELLRTFQGHTHEVTSLVFSPDGKLLISGSEDTSVRVWNVATGYHMALLSEGKDWVMYTPDGLFDSSIHGGRLLAMVRGMTPFGVDQFANTRNRPDLILQKVGVEDETLIRHFRNLHLRRLKRGGILQNQSKGKSRNPPTANITRAKLEGKFAEIDFSLRDEGRGLHSYNIFVNNVPLFGAQGKKIKGKVYQGKEKVELTSGDNKIEVSVINKANLESFRSSTSVSYQGKTKGGLWETRGDLYFLAFGVSRYKDPSLNLAYAAKDARDLGEVFSRMDGGTSGIGNNWYFRKTHIKTFLNEQVTVENIKNAKNFLSKARVDDTFVLFIAGHGVHDMDDDATYYFLTHGARLENLKDTAASFDLIEDLLQGIAPRKKLFLMDTCESGEVEENVQKGYFAAAQARGMKARTTRGIQVRLRKNIKNRPRRAFMYAKDRFIYNNLNRRSGAIVFSASRGGEFSYESRRIQNGYFTDQILNALTFGGADKNGDRSVSTNELREFVIISVPKLTGGEQHPTVDRDNIHQKFGFPLLKSGLFGVNPRKDIPEALKPASKPSLSGAVRVPRPAPFRDPVTGMEFVWVQGGEFDMGCGPWSGSCVINEHPLHGVRLDGFWMARHEVTQGQWKKVMGANPAGCKKGNRYPVEKVSW
ncbi:MAG: caspase family protein, partial [Nitrospinae bacterium]|nr:caspase family protein [Nitrospinota bacterium]